MNNDNSTTPADPRTIEVRGPSTDFDRQVGAPEMGSLHWLHGVIVPECLELGGIYSADVSLSKDSSEYAHFSTDVGVERGFRTSTGEIRTKKFGLIIPHRIEVLPGTTFRLSVTMEKKAKSVFFEQFRSALHKGLLK